MSLKNWLIEYITRKELKKLAETYGRGILLDIGCGIKPYESYFNNRTTKYIGIDNPDTIHDKDSIDIMGAASQMGIKSNLFDTALCTAVLEHLEEPETAVQDCYRILKSGGHAIYAVPFIWHIHEEPRDFFRYTKYGLEYIFRKAGFEILELKPLSGFCVTFSQLLVYFLYLFHRGPLKFFPVIPIVGIAIQALGLLMDTLYNKSFSAPSEAVNLAT